MTTTEVALAVEAWAVSIRPSLNTYPNDPGYLGKALPIVLCEVKKDRVTDAKEEFPERAYQQAFVRVWDCELLILESPDPAWTASQALYTHIDALGNALRNQAVISNDLFGSAFYEATYDPPEVEHEDGTVARAATMRLTVGEQLGGR